MKRKVWNANTQAILKVVLKFLAQVVFPR